MNASGVGNVRQMAVDVASVVAGAEIFHAVPGLALLRGIRLPLAPARVKDEEIVWLVPAPKVSVLPGVTALKALNVFDPVMLVLSPKSTS